MDQKIQEELNKLALVNEEFSTIENDISEFNYRHTVELGSTIQKLLATITKKYQNGTTKYLEASQKEAKYQQHCKEVNEIGLELVAGRSINDLVDLDYIELNKAIAKREELVSKLSALKQSENYLIIKSIHNWDSYFAQTKARILQEIEKIK
ncbi:MAG: hypothetical protein ACJAZ3_000665 [Sphingobacteriales bacterium]|jgi:hypothetical protein